MPIGRTSAPSLSLAVVEQSFVAAFFMLMGLSVFGCSDSGSVNPVVELASLTVDPGSLQPAFNGAITQYTVDLSNNITSVTITAQPAVAGDTVSINSQVTTSSVITLGAAGTTTPVSIVVSESGTNSRTYTVLLVRAGLTGNNSLQNLTVSPGALAPTFDENFQSYTVDVANSVGSITVTPTLSDPVATITVNGQATGSGQARTIPLNPTGQTTNIPIVVTAQNGSQKTYFMTVSRGVSGNNSLRSLTVSPGTLSPTFSASTVGYTINVANNVTSVTVTPTLQDTTASMTVNGQAAGSGQVRTIALSGAGSNTPIFIIVTAQNGTQKTYTVGVILAALGGNNSLSSLRVSPGTLEPNFNANMTSYTLDVGSGVTSVTITPTLQNASASMSVNGQIANSGQARTITLNGPGSNTFISIVVTAQNGTQKIYTVNAIRAAFGGNHNLSVLIVSPGALSPAFNPNTLTYSVDFADNVTSVTVSATKSDPNAVMSGSVTAGAGTATGQEAISLGGPGTSRVVSITVTAPSQSSKTYTITVERAAQAGDNNLQSLAVSRGTLTPAFNPDRRTYSVDVAEDGTSVTISATKSDPNALMSGSVTAGAGTATGQAAIPLGGPGTNTVVSITVTAPNQNSKTYTITVERAASASNNNLSALIVSPGTLTPPFNPNTTRYRVNVSSNVTSVILTAALQDTNAGMEVNGQGTSSGQAHEISLGAEGSRTNISIRVNPPNGNAKTYTITANRASSGDNGNDGGNRNNDGNGNDRGNGNNGNNRGDRNDDDDDDD